MTSCTATFGMSLDGFIATEDGGVDWLNAYHGDEMGPWFADFMAGIDALIMGRATFDVVCGFGAPWPYEKPVYVLSNTLIDLPADLSDKLHLAKGHPAEIVAQVGKLGHQSLYIDGGATVRAFLEADLIDRMIISHLPVLLGAGIPLFGPLPAPRLFTHDKTEILSGHTVVSHYRRDRTASAAKDIAT